MTLLIFFMLGMFMAAIVAFTTAFMGMDIKHPMNTLAIILAPVTLLAMLTVFIADRIAAVMSDIENRRS